MRSWALASSRVGWVERPLGHLSGLCPRKGRLSQTQGIPREGSAGALVQAGYKLLLRKPRVKELFFLATLCACKREVRRPGGRGGARIYRRGDGAEGALGLGVPGTPDQGTVQARESNRRGGTAYCTGVPDTPSPSSFCIFPGSVVLENIT